MTVAWAGVVLAVAAGYATLGMVFGVWFVRAGVGRLDPVAREGTWGFRLAILPGAVALWPWLAWRIVRGIASPPDERNAHRDAAIRRGGAG